jgi:F-type H+-transporting ATPase subunit b
VLPPTRTHLFAGLLVLTAPLAASAAEGGLVLVPEPGLLLTLIAFFVALIFPVNAFVFKPLLRVLDERNERITGTRAKAAKLQGNAAELLAQYERQVVETKEASERDRRSLLEEVRAEAQRETAAARSEAEGRIEQARREVNESLDGARDSLRAQSQELAREAAAQVLGRAV